VPPGRARDIQVVSQDRSLALASRLVDDDDDADGGWLTHCTALTAQGGEPALTVLDEDEIRARCPEVLPSTHVVDTLATLGVAAMGFGWQVLELNRGDGELFARVAADVDGSTPATWAGLLDAATSAASTIFDGPPRLRMPARIERVHVHDKPPAVALLHVRRRAAGTVTDVMLAEESGAVSVALTGMAFEELENPSGRDTVRLLHHVAWQPVEWPDADLPVEVVLVGGDDATLGFVARDLDEAGVTHRSVSAPTDLDDLVPGAVVLVLPRAGEAPQASAETVLRTLQRLDASGAQVTLWVLTSQVHEGVNPAHGPLWGMARVAAAEHPQLWGGVLDIAGDRLPVRALGALQGHGVVVVRDGVAYAARLAHAGPGEAAPLQCSPGGTYLITGGTGVLGLRLAQRLADLGARRLVLVSRSGIPNRSAWRADSDREAVAVVSALEQRGVSVKVAAVDVGAPGAVAALSATLADLPPVRGVIHAAGVEAGALLTGTTADDLGAAMRPKVDGVNALHELFPPGELDWMVLFSSCGYLAGFPGQGAYACGNAYLDAFARYRRRLGDRTTSVAWTAWRGMGMGSTSGFVAAQLDALGMGTVGLDDAMRALDSALRDDDPNVVVLPVLPSAASVPILADVAPAETADAPAPAVVDRGDEDVAEWAARQVLTAVSAELGCAADDVDTRLPLVEIGVDSIMTVALRRQLEKQTGLTLPPTLLWEYPTAAAVSERIAELLTAADDSAA
jgi:6-methylsalicylic acid synthase